MFTITITTITCVELGLWFRNAFVQTLRLEFEQCIEDTLYLLVLVLVLMLMFAFVGLFLHRIRNFAPNAHETSHAV